MSYSPVTHSTPDILAAFYAFLELYLGADVPPEAIFRGWENRYALPAGSNLYVVYSLMGATRVGTNVTQVDDEGNVVQSTCFEGRVQIDFCSDDEKARELATVCDSLFRSPVGPEFFRAHGFSSCYCDDMQSVEYVDASDQYVKRSTLTVHICYNTAVTLSTGYADTVKMNRIENVDVHHKPN